MFFWKQEKEKIYDLLLDMQMQINKINLKLYPPTITVTNSQDAPYGLTKKGIPRRKPGRKIGGKNKPKEIK